MGGALRAGSDHLQYMALRRWVRKVFNILLFLYFFDEKCESVLSTFSIPLYQNDQKGISSSYSRV